MRMVWISLFLLFFNFTYALSVKGPERFISDVDFYLSLYQSADMGNIKPGLSGSKVLRIANLKGIYHKDYTSIDENKFGTMPENYLAFYWNGYIVFNNITSRDKFVDTLFHEVGHAYYLQMYGKRSSESYADVFAIYSTLEIDRLIRVLCAQNMDDDLESYYDYEKYMEEYFKGYEVGE